MKVVAIHTAEPGAAERCALGASLDGVLAPSWGEPGNLWHDQRKPGRFFLDELYANADAVAAHRAGPHFQR